MVWVPEIEAHVHRFPVTKVQFEVFLADLPDGWFAGDWYSRVTAANPRLSPAQLGMNNYWSAFITGVQAHEALRFARWLGDGFSLPTQSDWDGLLSGALPAPLAPPPVAITSRVRARREQLLHRLEEISTDVASNTGRLLAAGEPRFLDLGVIEWVEAMEEVGGWSGRGSPHPAFFANLTSLDESLVAPDDDEIFRGPYGFRLLYRPLAG
jgi:hypothetical protein